MTDRASTLAAYATKRAETYEEKPGFAGAYIAGADAMVDLYRTIARLARIVEGQQRLIGLMMPDKSDDV